MKRLGLVLTTVLALALAGCGDGDSDDDGRSGSSGSGEGDGGFAQPEGPAPDLASLAQGTDPLKASGQSGYPDACSVLSEEMVTELMPGSETGKVQRSSEDQNGTAHLCQYAAADADDKKLAFIEVSFSQSSGRIPAESLKSSFESQKSGAAGDADYVDFKSQLGGGSSAYFDGYQVSVLLGDTAFTVSAGGPEPTEDDMALWLENVMVPVATNMVARMR